MRRSRALVVFSLVGAALAARGLAQDATPAPLPAEEPAKSVVSCSEAELQVLPAPGAPILGLREAIALALERNFGLLNSADGLVSARVGVSTSKAQFLPQLTPSVRGDADDQVYALDAYQKVPWTGASLRAQAAHRTNDRQDSLFPRTTDLRLTVTQPLLRGFGPTTTRFDLVNSQRGLVGRERSYEQERQRLAEDVTGAFYQVVRQRQLVAVARQSQERSLRLKVASEARLLVGLASKLDVLRAELQASQAESAAVSSEAALETALEQFRFLLGLPPTDPLEPEGVTLPEDIAEEPEPFQVLLERAFALRLDFRESQDQVRDAERSLRVARQRLLPQVDLNLGVLRTGFGNDLPSSWREADYRWDFYVTASYPLERTGDRAARANAELDLEARKRLLQQKRYEVEGQVRGAARDLERIRKTVELQGKNVDFAAQQHRLATLRYERGLASNFDVVDAEASLFSARTTLVALLADYQVARVRLQRITGELDVTSEFWK